MGKRHNTLSDDIFRNSKYIATLEKELKIDDFKKEYSDQYKIMLDVYKTLIIVNNIIFADSNKSIYDKNIEVDEALTECIGTQNYKEYHKKEDEKEEGKKTPIRSYKYSTRTLKGLVDSNTRLLYEKFKDWHETLYNDKTITNIKKDVEEEMKKLEDVNFDMVVKGGIEYEKNKDSNYKIYISKFNNLYTDYKAFTKQYKDDFSNNYGIDLNEEEMRYIRFIYDLVAYANNGIVKTLFDKEPIDFQLNETSTPEEYYKAYLTLLHLDIKDNELFKKNSETFLNKIIVVSKRLTEHLPKEKAFAIEMKDYINLFDYYYFIVSMKDIIDNKIDVVANNLLINKIINDLKEIYELITKDNEEEMISNYKEAFNKCQAIIERNKKYYERLS